MSLSEIRNLQTLLEKYYKQEIQLLECKTKLLTAPGENYGSVMLAAEVTFATTDNPRILKNLVAKMCPPNEKLCEIFNIQETFKRELNVYTIAVPAIEEFENEFNIRNNTMSNLFAKCYGGRLNLQPGSEKVDKDAILLLENLKLKGYDIGDRLTGFDLYHAKLIIKNLAIFHATPIAFKLLQPTKFRETLLSVFKNIELTVSEAEAKFMIQEVADVLETNEKCKLHIDKVIKSMEYNLLGNFRSGNPREPFATVVHTDFWTNNTMILRNEKGEPVHNKLVDFQLPIYNSFVHDLLFFIFSSVQSKVLQNNIDYLIKFYYDNFINRLKDFQVDVSKFNWQAFNDEIKFTAPLELGHTLLMFKPILTERGMINDMANYDESFIFRKDIVSKDFNSRLINTTLCYINRNWI